jgi:hypothetical protein
MNTRVFDLIILDESGLMSTIEKQAIDGVNETVQTIRVAQKKHEDQELLISTPQQKELMLCSPKNAVHEADSSINSHSANRRKSVTVSRKMIILKNNYHQAQWHQSIMASSIVVSNKVVSK